MSEDKKVRLAVLSRMRDASGEVHEIKNARRGTLVCGEQGVTIEYDDEQDGERAHIALEYKQGRARMRRTGMTCATLVFLPGQKTNSAYVTPYGEIPVAVDTRSVHLEQESGRGLLALEYAVYMGGEKTADTRFEIRWRV